MKFDREYFDAGLYRVGTRCEKWDGMRETHGSQVLPMWVADMDFPSPPQEQEAILRRAGQPAANEEKKIVRVRDLEVNIVNRSVTLGGKDVRLTAKEFDLLQLFINNRGKVFSREAMLETVWKYDYMGDARTVDVHIRRLREKIERNTSQPEFIFTKWGVGYYFTDKD